MNADNTQTIAAEVEKARAAMTAVATAMTNAAAALKDATAAAGEHVLALFRAANALDVEDVSMGTEENEAAMARLAAIVARFNAAATPNGTNLNSGGTAVSAVTVMYGLNTKDDEDTADKDESAPAKRAFTFDGGGETIVAADFVVAPNAAEGTMPEATKNYLLPVGDFAGVELTKGEMIAHVYTDIEQTTEGATTSKEVTTTDSDRATVDIGADNFDEIKGLAPVADKSGTDEDESLVNDAQTFMGTLTYDQDNNPDTDDVTYTGQFQCKATGTCSIERTSGAVTAFTNYEFVLSAKQTMEVMEKAADDVDGDYLTFGVWLDNNNGSPEIGAFALGSDVFTANTIEELTGTVSYKGSAVGVYTDGSSVEHFDGTANLMAYFGNTTVVDDPDTNADEAQVASFGYIEGTININGGGNTPASTVNLGRTTMTAGPFTPGNAWKGAAKPFNPETGQSPGSAYEGMWGSQFYGNPAEDVEGDAKLPGSVAGTFGVTGVDNIGTADDMDDDVTRSWIGTFGAHKQ